MNQIAAAILGLTLSAAALAQGNGGPVSDIQASNAGANPVTREDVRAVSPALDAFTQDALLGRAWKRPALSPRDRSIVTLAVLIARNQPVEMPFHVRLALDNGVTPAEISEIVAHLAFYSGWANAHGAVAAVKDVFAERGVRPDQLPAASPPLQPVDEAEDAKRAAGVQQNVGPVSPSLVEDTNGLLFGRLWRRPGLAPRDRSLITVSSLIALGQTAQMPYHLNRAMDAGLTKAQASEVVSHVAFYAGWPNAFSAVPVVKQVIEGRP
jgi:4-carboxymuconolactone decarboxylase